MCLLFDFPIVLLLLIHRIQVVTIVDHWAKLARGYGYVYFEDSSDLVRGKKADTSNKSSHIGVLFLT
jgi:hypothetical protein